MESEAIKTKKRKSRGLTRLEKWAGKAQSRFHRWSGRAIGIVRGRVMQNRIDAYWWDDFINFGDLITARLLEDFGFTPVHRPPGKARVIAVGSVLEHVPEDYTGIIIGAGLIRAESLRRFPRASVLALRGELTRQRLRAPEDTVLGDPGLLIARLMKERREKTFVLGIVPHYTDRGNGRLREILNRHPKEVCLIDPRRDPVKVVRDIDQCEFILSSSLHGLVCSDALGIPNAWLSLSDHLIGRGFKFRDYYSVLKKDPLPVLITGNESLPWLVGQTSRPTASLIADTRDTLEQAFFRIKETVSSTKRQAG